MPYIGQSPSQVAFVTDTFNGTGSTTVYTMSVAPANTSSALVAVSGVLQTPSTYSVSGTTLTFSTAPPTGTGNISVRYLGIPASGVTTTAYRTVTEFTATSGQTTFTPPSYTVGFINVYRNGVLLGAADYTATNGTTVVLAIGAYVGDLVTVESFLVSSVLNAIPATAGAVSSTYLQTGITINSPVIDTLKSSTGVFSVQNAMTGIPKAWGSYAGVAASAPTLRSAFNISSVTRNSTGNLTFAFTTALPNANYGVLAGIPLASGNAAVVAINTKTTTSFIAVTQYTSSLGGAGTVLDGYNIDFAVFGS